MPYYPIMTVFSNSLAVAHNSQDIGGLEFRRLTTRAPFFMAAAAAQRDAIEPIISGLTLGLGIGENHCTGCAPVKFTGGKMSISPKKNSDFFSTMISPVNQVNINLLRGISAVKCIFLPKIRAPVKMFHRCLGVWSPVHR